MSGRPGVGGPWVDRVLPGGEGVRFRRFQGTVPLAELAVEAAVAAGCAACPQYGRQFSCPPHSPTLFEYVGDATHATVVCLELSMEHLSEPDPALRQRLGFRRGQHLLAEELLAARSGGHRVAGCGACPSCATCSAADGEPSCRSPERRIYSLESLGVNVVELLRRCFGVELAWGGPETAVDTVHAVGAVFHRG